MKGIVPHLWFDNEVREAVDFYISLFENSRIISIQELEDTPSGDAETIYFELAGQRFGGINGGPYFTFNPAISFMISCKDKEEVDEKWHALAEDGKILMPLQEYPFSPYYGWIEDKYGLSWQLGVVKEQDIKQKITPNLLFSGEVLGKVEEALEFYEEAFSHSGVDLISYYEPGEAENSKAKVNFSSFLVEGMLFNAMDNGSKMEDQAGIAFNEAISFLIVCEKQEEINYYWDKLSAVPEAEECGWLKDKFGVSWQVSPDKLDELLENGTREQIYQVTQAFLKMKKIEIAELEKIWEEAK